MSSRVTQLSAVTTLNDSDLFYTVTGVSGTNGTNNSLSFLSLKNNLPASGGGGLTLVDHQTVAGSDAQDITLSGLDGDTDGGYLIRAIALNNSGTTTKYTLRPNNLTTNQSSAFDYAGVAVRTAASIQLSDDTADITNGIYVQWKIDIQPRTGFVRGFRSEITILTTGPAAAIATSSGVWNETSTNITSIVLHAANAGGFKIGSNAQIYKYQQS